MTMPADRAEEPGDVEDLDDLEDEFDVDRPVPIVCQWGMPGWCSTGRHHRCYSTANADAIKTGTYGHHDGHVWVCPCLCHAHQGYSPCPHSDHEDHAQPDRRQAPPPVLPVQVNLF